jgi:flagellar protein FlaG
MPALPRMAEKVKEQGGTKMSISSVGTVTDLTPIQDFRRVQVKSAEGRAAVERLTASLPGSGARKNAGTAELGRLTADIESVSETFNKKLKFVVDHRSNEVIVKVIDKNTDKVIKVIPPEELQRLHRMLKETIGFLFNEEV